MSAPISLREAQQRVADLAVSYAATERVPLLEAAGRYLAQDLYAEGPWPQTDRSAMDGFALATGGAGSSAGQGFPVVGEALAGKPFEGRLESGQAARIMTGGVVPDGADAVAKVEDTDGYAGEQVTIRVEVPAGANIRPMGSEIAAGALLIRQGRRIRAAEIGALAVLGQAEVEVRRRPRVAILSTGDEVVGIDREPLPHQVRDSNSWALAAKAAECGAEVTRLGIAADEARALRAALEKGLEHDVLITIGGVSKGTHDLVHGSLEELGVEKVFHGIALKPGKPAYCGKHQRGEEPGFVFGLPGNPASSFVTFDLLVSPLLAALCGGRWPVTASAARAGEAFRKNWREQAIPTRLDADGRAVLAASRPSGDPFGLLDGAFHALVPGGTQPDEVDRVTLWPYSSTDLGESPA